MANENLYDNIPNAVAAIIGPNAAYFIGTVKDTSARRKELLNLTDQLTRTMVAAVAERERPTFDGKDD